MEKSVEVDSDDIGGGVTSVPFWLWSVSRATAQSEAPA
jgi:hypothetical protein